ncbi:phytosulfokines 3 [Tanacetum coccineum]
MPKAITLTTLCTISILLLSMLCYSVGRPAPAFSNVSLVETDHSAEEMSKGDVEENCKGDGEEDCLMRRTLVAHVDYIYTQNKQP